MFETPEQMAVREEYIVVPAFKMIGDIGGILGIFIGFAFSPFVTQIIECCQYLISIIFVKWTGKLDLHSTYFDFGFLIYLIL